MMIAQSLRISVVRRYGAPRRHRLVPGDLAVRSAVVRDAFEYETISTWQALALSVAASLSVVVAMLLAV